MMRIRELRVSYHPIPGATLPARQIKQPVQALDLFRPLLATEASEVFMIACLDAKLRLIAVHVVGRGTLDGCMVHPREVFKAAILANAASIITAHNHPSGDPTPSPEDRALFQRLNESGRLLGVEVLDHLIIGEGERYWSNQHHHLRA